MNKYYLSKNYADLSSAGNKAKTDIEVIFANNNFKNAGLKQTGYSNKVLGFVITLLGVLKACLLISKGDLLVLQYPLKKYYSFICKVVHLRGGKITTVIHDLGTFRRGKLTASQEIARLNNSDYIIAHNKSMESWLKEHGNTSIIGCLEIFDYLSEESPKKVADIGFPFNILYVGGLSYKKNSFLYKLEEYVKTYRFTLYGSGFNEKLLGENNNYTYKGFVPSDELIATAEGHFGLVWDGDSISCCSGAFGEYLQYNNPHKTSLYIRCQLPIIIWKKAALAEFVESNNIGICIDSLVDLNQVLASISTEQYHIMKINVIRLSEKLASGYFMTKALKQSECSLY
jgi:hypothetical protein